MLEPDSDETEALMKKLLLQSVNSSKVKEIKSLSMHVCCRSCNCLNDIFPLIESMFIIDFWDDGNLIHGVK